MPYEQQIMPSLFDALDNLFVGMAIEGEKGGPQSVRAEIVARLIQGLVFCTAFSRIDVQHGQRQICHCAKFCRTV